MALLLMIVPALRIFIARWQIESKLQSYFLGILLEKWTYISSEFIVGSLCFSVILHWHGHSQGWDLLEVCCK